MNLLEGKTAIITGGTRGIGFGIAKKFLENGANVAVCGSRQSSVDKALAEFAELGYTDTVMGIVPDLSDPASIETEFAKVVERFGRLDILGNNAGMSSRTPMADYTAEEFRKVMELNVDAVFFCSQAAVKIFRAQGSGGSIVNTSSMVGRYGQPSGVAYPTSKFAVNGLTLSLARELARDGIRVNAVAPGAIDTDMLSCFTAEDKAAMAENSALGRIGRPEDISRVVAFLASEAASFVTGQVLGADGGLII